VPHACRSAADASTTIAAPRTLTREDARRRAAQVANPDTAIELSFDGASPTYRGVATIEFDLVGSPEGLWLDFAGRATAVDVNGKRAADAVPAVGRIPLPAARLVPGRNTVRVEYENAYDHDGAGCHRVTDVADGRAYVFTDFEPFNASRLFPSFDQPDVKGTYEWTVTTPADWIAVTNGVELSAVSEGDRVVRRFQRTPRFSTYVAAVCAGPYAVWSDPKARIPSRILAPQSLAKYVDVAEIFDITRSGFEFFDGYFGVPYPYGKYDQVFVPEFNWGAMENVACVVHSDRFVHRKVPTDRERLHRASVILHEMAHMWFGNLVTMEWWDDLWLNESFATYMERLAVTKATRFVDAFDAFRLEEKRWAYWQDELPTTHPIAASVPDTTNAFTNFDGITYGKGASVLKQLAFFVGADAFRRGVGTYLTRHAGRNARLEHFLAAIGEAAGRDLSEWSRLWLTTSGLNGLRPVLKTEGGVVRSCTLEQTPGNGDAVLRPHRLRVAAWEQDAGGSVVPARVVDVEVSGAVTRVPAFEGAKAPAFLFANHEDQAYAKLYLDPASLAFATDRLDRFESTLQRAEVWAATWAMVRDRETPPTAYARLFLSKAGLETSDALVDATLRNVKTLLGSYLPEPARAEFVRSAHELAWDCVKGAPAGGDLQRTWLSILVATAEEPVALDRVADLLAGRERPPGLVLDVERRWELATRLAAFAHPAAEEALASLRKSDATDRGARAAFKAEVAHPDAGAKARAWERFTGDAGARLDFLREGMGAFAWPHQRELVRPFVPRFFEGVRTTAAARDLPYAQAYVMNLFPEVVVEPGTAAAARDFLGSNPSLPGHLRRALVEKAAELERALAVRATIR
jgi:aminopeptidase N